MTTLNDQLAGVPEVRPETKYNQQISGSITETLPSQGIAEKALLSQYQGTLDEIAKTELMLSADEERLKALRVQERHLYKLACVIDPSLKKTRPKS